MGNNLGHFLYSTKRLRIADLDYWKTKQNKTVTNLVAQNLQKKFANCTHKDGTTLVRVP
jgi:hypothetical protein